MKKNIIRIVFFITTVSLIAVTQAGEVVAQQKGESGNIRTVGLLQASSTGSVVVVPQGSQNQERSREQAQNSSSGTSNGIGQMLVQEKLRTRLEYASGTATSVPHLVQMIKERVRELEQEGTSSVATSSKNTIRNQNQVRVAVHALLASDTLLGGIGPQVSAIAREFNASVATTTRAENRILSRNFFSRFFFGGDKENSASIQSEVSHNRVSIKQLSNLLENSTISVELREMLKNQITILEQEQNRLFDLAEQEKNRWGIFNWRF